MNGQSSIALIHELFETQAARTPDAVAVKYADAELTYRELDRRANQLARYLSGKGAGPDCLIGICAERSLEMAVGLFGILKSGAAYVPFDPSYPTDRLAYMLEDAQPRVILTQAHLVSRIPVSAQACIALDNQWEEIARQSPARISSQELRLRSNNLCYVIYTSGSTGKPKGAMNEHRGLVNRLQWMQSEYGLTDRDRILQKTPFSFDVSVWEFFWTLSTGARLVMARPEGHKDPAYLSQLIEEEGITRLHFVPSMLLIFLDQHRVGRCASLQHVICSGEELPASLTKKFFAAFPRARLSNLYGPTEAAIDVTSWECQPRDESPRVPIGRPIANTQMHVLDSQGQPVPSGVAGELHIGGVQVGRGYLNRPELTAERFIRDPFSKDPEARLYKTGDLGRLRADGAIEYLGRNDHQVKIRGFRIELGEIEAQLRRQRNIKEAVVLAREDAPGEKRLVAYFTSEEGAAPGSAELRAALESVLPDYMVPKGFVRVEHWPLSPNGKLDRAALPAPLQDAFVSREFESPSGPVEEVLAVVWGDVLHIDRIGRNDNFFELGGHSLLLVRMLQQLRARGFTANVSRLFENLNLRELASEVIRRGDRSAPVPISHLPEGTTALTPDILPLVKLSTLEIERIVERIPGGALNIQNIYPLAPLQEGILFHHLLGEGAADPYVLPTLIKVVSRERLNALVAALQNVINRHDVLRTAILWEGLPQPVQVVQRTVELAVEQVALVKQADIQSWLAADQQRLDLRRAPLAHLRVAADPNGPEWYALLQLHHIVSDHETLEKLIAELTVHLEQRTHELIQPVPYVQHVAQALEHSRKHDAQAFFRQKLADITEPTAAFGLLDVHADGSRIAVAHRPLDSALGARVRARARVLGVSPATLFHAGWSLIVARTSARDDVVFGTLLSGRLQGDAGTRHTMGMFINTLPLRLPLRGLSVIDLVRRTQRELADLLQHEQASLAVAQRCSGVEGATPLFGTLLNCLHSTVHLETERLDVAPGIEVLQSLEWTNYPISLSVDDQGGRFVLIAQTDRRIEPERILRYVSATMTSLLDFLEHAPEVAALKVAVLPEEERQQVLDAFNSSQAGYPLNVFVHELIAEQARRAPDATAIVCGPKKITYRELKARSDRLAQVLQKRGVGPDARVAVYAGRSTDMVVGFLAILKAGGAYLPLDLSYPRERIEFMLEDSAPTVILAERQLISAVPAHAAQVLAIDSDETVAHEGLGSRPIALEPHHLAYIIYTSGSTGTPKGVLVTHRNFANLVHYHCESAQLSSASRCSCLAGLSFDATVLEMWPVLSAGGTLVLAPHELTGDVAGLLSWWSREPLDVCFLPTPIAELAFSQGIANSHVSRLMVGGDRLRQRLLGQPYQLINCYGPTETTVISTTGLISDDDPVLHIGKPIANTRIYLLNEQLQPVPVGVPGELYIGGEGVTRGYLNRPDLTAERFLLDPFRENSKARMYRTGDLARWRPDGTIEYLGRNDHQVKIRGLRIELGEIEVQLLRSTQVKEAIVLLREDSPGEKRLVAYLTARETTPIHIEALRQELARVLPDYMVPSAFVLLQSLPITPNGKVDRRALPIPEIDAFASREYQPPEGKTEEALAILWQEILGVARVGREDNFFALGGHSLFAMQLLMRVRTAWSIEMKLSLLFEAPTLRALASEIDRRREKEDEAALLEEVASMSESEIEELMQALTMRERR